MLPGETPTGEHTDATLDGIGGNGPSDENLESSDGVGANSSESDRQRRVINMKKMSFRENNLILNLGSQDQECGCCGAMVWAVEFTGRHVGSTPKGYSICFGKGKVQLPLLQDTPPELLGLLTSNDRQSRVFFNKSRVYNTMFAFCSFGGTIDDSVNKGKGPYVFRVTGQIYHKFGSLVPPDGCETSTRGYNSCQKNVQFYERLGRSSGTEYKARTSCYDCLCNGQLTTIGDWIWATKIRLVDVVT